MNYAFDVETTTFQKGNPFSIRNKLVLNGLYNPEEGFQFYAMPSKEDMLIGFNIKFDLHWLQRDTGVPFPGKIWDVQLAHYMLTGQKKPYPSLNEVSEYYGHGQKLDVIKEQYWDKGIDTDQIPMDVLMEYLTQDLILTWKCYESQQEQFKENPQLYKLFLLACRDLQVLQEMEWNGLKLNENLAQEKAKLLAEEIKVLTSKLNLIYPQVPINWGSVDDLSVFLYGGVIVEEKRWQSGVFKTGQRAGQPRFNIDKIQHTLPRLVKPIKGTELKKEGYWSTDDKTIRQLKGAKKIQEILSWITALREKSKLHSTYYQGFLDLRREMDWPECEIHGQFNQCVVPTGRLSSSNPNQQNLPELAAELFESVYQ